MANKSGYFFRVLRQENPSEEFRGDASVAVSGGRSAPKPKADNDFGQHLELYFNENLMTSGWGLQQRPTSPKTYLSSF